MDYGTDTLYSRLGAEAIDGWHQWNARWGRDVYHEDGFMLLSSQPLERGGFELQSFETLSGQGWALQRLSAESVGQRFPGWNSDYYVDGYLNPRGGWAEAATATSLLARDAEAAGIAVRTGFSANSLIQENGAVRGVTAADGSQVRADRVVVAAGVWTPTLLPELSGFMQPSGQPILYFRPPNPERFRGPQFPPWGADMPRSGWYGFPANEEGVLKIANHGPGGPPDPASRGTLRCKKLTVSGSSSTTTFLPLPKPQSLTAGCVGTATLGTAISGWVTTRNGPAWWWPPAAAAMLSSSRRC
jgi:glycine/D-amino acid oxidase-like deaminating enzyme